MSWDIGEMKTVACAERRGTYMQRAHGGRMRRAERGLRGGWGNWPRDTGAHGGNVAEE